MTCITAITTLSMVLTVFVLNLHHIQDRPVPPWIKTLFLRYLARMLCMTQFIPKCEVDDAIEIKDEKRNKYRVTPNSLGKAIGNQIGLLASLNGTLGMGDPEVRNRNSKQHSDQHGSNYKSQYTFTEEGKKDKDSTKMKEEEYAKDWKRLAEVADRIFFLVFLSAIVITTLLLFHPLTKSYFSLLGDEAMLRDEKHL